MSSQGAVRRVNRLGLPCHYCNERPGTTSDHIIPLVLGGPNSMWNLVPACPTCNHDKMGNWPTCECQKCQDAIVNFCSNPERYRKALDVLGGREAVIQGAIDGISSHLQTLRGRQAEAVKTYEHVLDLTLTYDPR